MLFVVKLIFFVLILIIFHFWNLRYVRISNAQFSHPLLLQTKIFFCRFNLFCTDTFKAFRLLKYLEIWTNCLQARVRFHWSSSRLACIYVLKVHCILWLVCGFALACVGEALLWSHRHILCQNGRTSQGYYLHYPMPTHLRPWAVFTVTLGTFSTLGKYLPQGSKFWYSGSVMSECKRTGHLEPSKACAIGSLQFQTIQWAPYNFSSI